MPDENGDPGKILILEMVKGMALLSKSNDLLAQKIEDLTSAIDDVRDRLDGATEMNDEMSGYMGAMLKILEDTSKIGSEREVKWGDVKSIISEMKREVEESEEEEIEEDAR
jgi:hypothetical protein